MPSVASSSQSMIRVLPYHLSNTSGVLPLVKDDPRFLSDRVSCNSEAVSVSSTLGGLLTCRLHHFFHRMRMILDTLRLCLLPSS